MHRIDLIPPVVEGQSAMFFWRVEPESALYRKTSFTLTFPAGIDLSRVPGRLWWDILLICLHPHWLLLRPCEIHLPLRLAEGERQFWLRLLQNGADTLAAYGPEQLRSAPLGISIMGGDLDVPRAPIAGRFFGTAFSSGKDSLLQAGLLCELTERPLLVTTTSPLPPLADHQTKRRREVLAAIQARRDVQFVEATSDFRSTWDNGFAGELGYAIAVNELTDTFLYMSSLLVAGAALGATRLFLASEAEVQVNDLVDGKIAQHKHFMYAAATQRALALLLAPYGIRFGSLTWPLYSMQVQQLLWARYPDLSDLQYTCWRVGPDEATCSQCEQCFRIAMTALANGDDPERMGIDLLKVVAYAPAWEQLANREAGLPRLSERDRVHGWVMDAVARVSFVRLVAAVARGRRPFVAPSAVFRTLSGFRRLQRRARRLPRPSPVGVREAFFDWLDPDLRDRLVAIYTQQFPCEPQREHAAIFERSRTLTLQATSALE